MKKSQIALLIVGVLVTAGVPCFIAMEQANQARIEMERARQATFQAQEAAEAQQQALEEEQEAIRQRAAEQEREIEARRAEEQARRDEEARIAAAQRAAEQERLAAQQREQQQMAARTAEAWEQFAEVMVNAEGYAEDPEADPMVMLKYVVNSLEPISLRQVDPKVATLVGDVRDASNQMYALITDFQERQEQLGSKAWDDGMSGCEIVNSARKENSLLGCAIGVVFGSGISYAAGSEELEQLRVEYASRIENLAASLEAYDAELETMPSYLKETYGLDVMEI
ncbi:MAG: hypothetical protein HC824_19010 [Synechococcales cyanobacterium RM1_1_8]|nr:hypothetical protein [Synechococcales cyanobacterium RM1_1_8]